MKTLLLALACVSLLVGKGWSKDDEEHAGGHVLVQPDDIKWGPAPPGLPLGSKMAILVGDPGKANSLYVARASLPDGYKIPPHWHPGDENVTVLKGRLLMGEGEMFDPEKMDELTVGSFIRMPKNMRHFALAKGETIIQLHGIGPFEINYVNPADDPRNKENKPEPVAKGAVGKLLTIPDEFKELQVIAYFTLEKPEGKLVEQAKAVVVTVYKDAKVERIDGGKRVPAKAADIKPGQSIELHDLEEGIRVGDSMRIAARSIVIQDRKN